MHMSGAATKLDRPIRILFVVLVHDAPIRLGCATRKKLLAFSLRSRRSPGTLERAGSRCGVARANIRRRRPACRAIRSMRHAHVARRDHLQAVGLEFRLKP